MISTLPAHVVSASSAAALDALSDALLRHAGSTVNGKRVPIFAHVEHGPRVWGVVSSRVLTVVSTGASNATPHPALIRPRISFKRTSTRKVRPDGVAGACYIRSDSSARVLHRRHRLQVRRSDTRMDTAQVVDLEARRDRSVHPLVGNAMRSDRLPVQQEHPVAVRPLRPCPQPALARLVDLRPETIFGGLSHRPPHLACPMSTGILSEWAD